jgi:hypothetical protein
MQCIHYLPLSSSPPHSCAHLKEKFPSPIVAGRASNLAPNPSVSPRCILLAGRPPRSILVSVFPHFSLHFLIISFLSAHFFTYQYG